MRKVKGTERSFQTLISLNSTEYRGPLLALALEVSSAVNTRGNCAMRICLELRDIKLVVI